MSVKLTFPIGAAGGTQLSLKQFSRLVPQSAALLQAPQLDIDRLHMLLDGAGILVRHRGAAIEQLSNVFNMSMMWRRMVNKSVRGDREVSYVSEEQVARAVRSLQSHQRKVSLRVADRVARLALSKATYDNPDNSELYRVVGEYLNLQGGVALDVGSSNNDLPARGLIDSGMAKVYRVDNNHKFEASAVGNAIVKTRGDATRLPFPDESCHTVVHNQGLSFVGEYADTSEAGKRWLREHPDEEERMKRTGAQPAELSDAAVEAALKESFRVLHPDGWILIKPGSHLMGDLRNVEGPYLENMLRQVGFEDVVVIHAEGSKFGDGELTDEEKRGIAEMFRWSDEKAKDMFDPIDIPVFIYARKPSEGQKPSTENVDSNRDEIPAKSFGLPDFIDDPKMFPLTEKEQEFFRDRSEMFSFVPQFARYYLYLQSRINPMREDYSVFVPGGVHRFVQAILLTDATELVIADPQEAVEFQVKRIERVGGKVLSGPTIDTVELNSVDGENTSIKRVTIEFEYRGKVRRLRQYCHNAFDPDFYPAELSGGYDAYLELWMRSSSMMWSSDIVESYPGFNARALNGLRPGGHVVMDSAYTHMISPFISSVAGYRSLALPHTYPPEAGIVSYVSKKSIDPIDSLEDARRLFKTDSLVTKLVYWKDVEGYIASEFSRDGDEITISKEYIRDHKRAVVKSLRGIRLSLTQVRKDLRERAIAWLKERCHAPIRDTKIHTLSTRGEYSRLSRYNADDLALIEALNTALQEVYREAFDEVFSERQS